jgi:dephospho-CoA kinase
MRAAGWDTLTHELWTVVVKPEVAVARLQARNGLFVGHGFVLSHVSGLSEAEALQRLAAQKTELEKLPNEQILRNDGTLQELMALTDRLAAQVQARLTTKAKL